MIINSVGGLGRLIEFKTCQKKSAITLGGRKRPQAAFVVSCSLAHTRENRGSSVGQEAALEPATSEKKTHKKKKKNTEKTGGIHGNTKQKRLTKALERASSSS